MWFNRGEIVKRSDIRSPKKWIVISQDANGWTYCRPWQSPFGGPIKTFLPGMLKRAA